MIVSAFGPGTDASCWGTTILVRSTVCSVTVAGGSASSGIVAGCWPTSWFNMRFRSCGELLFFIRHSIDMSDDDNAADASHDALLRDDWVGCCGSAVVMPSCSMSRVDVCGDDDISRKLAGSRPTVGGNVDVGARIDVGIANIALPRDADSI